MKFELFLARRYFRGHRRDSRFLSFIKAMAITGVAVGAAGLLIALSIVHGFKSVINDKILGFAPHITIETAAQDPIFRADTLETWLMEMDGLAAAQQVVVGDIMVQSREDISGSLIKGVDPAGDVSDLHTWLVSGSYQLGPDEEGRPGIILGANLASAIGAEIGSTVTTYTIEGIPTPLNTPEIIQFHLSGIYQTGIERFDDAFALADIRYVRSLFGLGTLEATGLDIRVTDSDEIEALYEQIDSEVRFPLIAETIYQRYRNIFAWIDLQEQTIPFVISVMVLIAAFNLIGTILMMILERVRDIGILKTMGAKSRDILRVFILEGLFVAAYGLAIGIGIAMLFNWVQGTWQLLPLAEENYYMSYVPVEPHLLDFLIVVGVTLLLCTLASWIPARFAARTDPVNVLSFGK